MAEFEGLVFELVSIDALLARAIPIEEVTTLHHEVAHDTVEEAPLVSDRRVIYAILLLWLERAFFLTG